MRPPVVGNDIPAKVGTALVVLVPALSGIDLTVGGAKPSELLILIGLATTLWTRPNGKPGVDAALLRFLFALSALALGLAGLHFAAQGGSLNQALRVGLQPAMLMVLTLTIRATLPSLPQRKRAVRLALFAASVSSIIAILQVLDVPGVRSVVLIFVEDGLAPVPGETGLVRATGLFPIWHSLAGYLLPWVIIAAGLLAGQSKEWRTRSTTAAAGLGFAAILVSLSISSIGGLAIGFVAVAVLYRISARVPGLDIAPHRRACGGFRAQHHRAGAATELEGWNNRFGTPDRGLPDRDLGAGLQVSARGRAC